MARTLSFSHLASVYWLLTVITVTFFPVYIYILNPIITPGRLLSVLLVPFLLLFFVFSSTVRRNLNELILKNKWLFILMGCYFIARMSSIFYTDDHFLAVGQIALEFSQIVFCFL